MLNVENKPFMLGVIMLSVVAPCFHTERRVLLLLSWVSFQMSLCWVSLCWCGYTECRSCECRSEFCNFEIQVCQLHCKTQLQKRNDITEVSFTFTKSLCVTFIKYHYDFHYAEFCYADGRSNECLGAILVPCLRFVNKFFWLSKFQAEAQNKESLKRLLYPQIIIILISYIFIYYY
jgi:hypothetical protein